MKGSVKIMLSHDYCHFEIALSKDGELTEAGVNDLRKSAQRLADEAVRQYKAAKEMAQNREQAVYDRKRYLDEIGRIEAVPESERNATQVAILKHHQDGEWEKQFDFDYDYDEDDEAPDFDDDEA